MSGSAQRAVLAGLADLGLPGRVYFGRLAADPVRRLSSGVARVDEVLDGGVACGRVNELCGPHSSGKTSVLLRLLAVTTQRGEVVACVDPAAALHPASVARAGADLRRVLWVRPPSMADAMRCTELLLQAGGFAVIALDLGATAPRTLRHRVWPRLAYAAEQSHTALVVLTPQRVAGSFTVLSLRLQPRRMRWHSGQWPLFAGFDSTLQVARSKLGPPGRWTELSVGDLGGGSRAIGRKAPCSEQALLGNNDDSIRRG